ncbi:MAG: MATE family efflux transporter [Halanaerobiales bacterium]
MLDLEKKRDLILNGKMTKVILLLAGPIMLNNVIQSIYNITDTYFVSQLGSTQMAAMTLVFPVIFFFTAIGMGIDIAGISLISQYIGDSHQQKASRVAGEVLSTAFIISIVLGIPGAIASPLIIRLMGGSGELLVSATKFLRIMMLGMPTLFLFFAFSAIMQGQGDMVTPMKFTGFSVGLNIILDPIFIFTFDLGIAGAAYATVLSRGLFAAYAIYTLFYKQNGLVLHKEDLKLTKNVFKLIRVGIPSSIGQSMAAFGFMFLNGFIIAFGSSTLAAFGIGNRINSLILMPAMGIGKTLATIVGQNLGADQILRARKAVKTSALLSTIFLVVGGVLFFPFIPAVLKLFSEEADVISRGVRYLRLITLSLPLMGFFQIFVGTFQGSGHTIYAMFLTMGRLWALRLPMILLFKNYTTWGSDSVWFAMVLSNAITALVGFGIYLSRRWEEKVIEDEEKFTEQKVVLSNK